MNFHGNLGASPLEGGRMFDFPIEAFFGWLCRVWGLKRGILRR